MKTMFIPLVFIGIFAGCAYFEHKEIEARLEADSERLANARELAVDYGLEIEEELAERAVELAISKLVH